MYTGIAMVMTTEEAGRLRWVGMNKAERKAAAREAVNLRWERWREENPEKAAASEKRRQKRATKKGRKK
jgi:post-segregation antitoxin (ccd killing protein)